MESFQCDLHEYLDTCQIISWNNSFAVLEGISHALFYLHEVKNIVHHNLCKKTVVLTKAFVAKLTSFESAVSVPGDANAEEKRNPLYDKSRDVFCFGEVLVDIISYTNHEKKQLQSLYETMHKFAEECLSPKSCSTSQLGSTIENYR